MSAPDEHPDVPPVILREPEVPPPPPVQDAARAPDTPQSTSRGQRFDPAPRESTSTKGIPNWLIWVGMVGLLAIGINEGSAIPIVFGAVIFFLLQRRKRR